MRRSTLRVLLLRTRVQRRMSLFPRWGVLVLLLAFLGLSVSVTALHAAGQASSSSASPAKKKAGKKRSHASSRRSTQKAPTADRITDIQSALARGGYYDGDPNGKWDATTIAAMQKFQSANGLEATGKLDALSLQKLGLGSDIAGVSAPRPVASAGSAGPVSSLSPSGVPASTHSTSAAALPTASAGNLFRDPSIAASTPAAQ